MAGSRRERFDRSAMIHVAELQRVARRLCGRRSCADDLVQETLLQAWRSFDRFEAGTNCRAWLYRILFFCWTHDRRRQVRDAATVALDERLEDALRFDPATPDLLTVETVRAAFEALPEIFRTIVMLVDVEQLTYREAAEALDLPVGTVMSRLSRARRLLRLELAAHAEAAGVIAHGTAGGREPS